MGGAGKTIFVKLLRRLYEATECKILFGANRSIPYDKYYKVFSVYISGLQVVSFTVRENIQFKTNGDV